MSVLSASTAASVWPSVVSAIGSVSAALIAGYIVIRSQSYKQLLEEIKAIADDSEKEITKAVRKALRQSLGGHRRWYERDDHDEPEID